MAIQTVLPDPTHKIADDGQENTSSGAAGPGFKTVTLISELPRLINTSNSGISYRALNRYQKWKVNIRYNDLIKSEIEAVYLYLLQRQADQLAFFVDLPQYSQTVSANSFPSTSAYEAGVTTFARASSGAGQFTGIAKGALFHVTDPTDLVHKKAYKVVSVSSTQIEFTPPLQRKIDPTSNNPVVATPTISLIFDEPRVRVIAPTNEITYTLNSSGLYSFSVNLEEALG